MKTARLSFDGLSQEFTPLTAPSLRAILGGYEEYRSDMYSNMFHTTVYVRVDNGGFEQIRFEGSEDWIPVVHQLNEVTIVGPYNHNTDFTGFGFSRGYQFGEDVWVFHSDLGGGGGTGGGGTVGNNDGSPLDVVRQDFVGGYIETLTLNHLDAYNFLDGMQNGLTLAGIAVTATGLTNITQAASNLVGAVFTAQGLSWGNIETNYMNSGYNQGITIEKISMSGQHIPIPNVTYIIKASNGSTLGTVSSEGW